MATALNLQRNSEIFLSTVDINGGGTGAQMTPTNTWKVEVLAGFATSKASGTQDITSSESGLCPDRSTQRFNTSVNPTEWNLQAYLRPTGITTLTPGNAGADPTGNAQPLADWFMWQGLLSNTAFATGTGGTSKLQSAWQTNGTFPLAARAASANVAGHTPNFAVATQYQMYVKMDNVVYQVKNATMNEAAIDSAIDGIATTSWSGFGTDLIELTGASRNDVISVTGGTLNDGTSVTANAHHDANVAAHGYHKWGISNVNGTVTTAAFIKNRLSSIDVRHQPSALGASVNYTFPVTGLGVTYNNALTYLTPEELSTLNIPIGQFTGSRTITGNFTAYLRGGNTTDSAVFLRNVVNDTRVNSAQTSNANLQIGGTSAPYVAVNMPAVQFNFPTTSVEDIISLSVEFLAQETTAGKGTGDEISMFVSGAS